MFKAIKNLKERWEELPKSEKYLDLISFVVVFFILFSIGWFYFLIEILKAINIRIISDIVMFLFVVFSIIIAIFIIIINVLNTQASKEEQKELEKQTENHVVELLKDKGLVEVQFLMIKLLSNFFDEETDAPLQDTILDVWNTYKTDAKICAKLDEDQKVTLIFSCKGKEEKQIKDFPKDKFLEYFLLKEK